MLSIILNWLYVIFISLGLGIGVSEVSDKVFKYRIKSMDSLLMAGLAVSTVYAQIFSLFSGVGMLANVLLAFACVIIYIWCRKRLKKYFIEQKGKKLGIYYILFVALMIVWAYFTSRGYMHYDSDLYHAQSIRWIEEYGVVPGLGNIHVRFAYNSSFFALSALYSMKFLTGVSMHAMSGFFAFVLSLTALKITQNLKEKKLSLSGFARIGLLYYLIVIMDEVVSPASDYSIMCVIFFIVIKWLDLLENEEKQAAPYALLCVLGVYALTLKLTAGLIVLLVSKPLYQLIKEKKGKEIIIYICMGLIVAFPWFARTVVISGWLLYPLPSLDLFSFDWEMPAALIKSDAAQITTWGRALYNESLIDVPITQWFPNWFSTTLSGMEKILILGNCICLVIFVADVTVTFLKRNWKKMDTILIIGVVMASYLFWQLSAPLIRYGYAYVLLLDFLVVGWILIRTKHKIIQNVVYVVLALYGVYKLFALGDYIYDTRLVETYIWQMEYGKYELNTFQVGNHTFYYPEQGDRTGYDSFPSLPREVEIRFRGDDIKDGFYSYKL